MNKTPITYRQEKSHLGSMERSFTDQSTLQEDERMALSFMDAHTCGARGTTDVVWGVLRDARLRTLNSTRSSHFHPVPSQATAVVW